MSKFNYYQKKIVDIISLLRILTLRLINKFDRKRYVYLKKNKNYNSISLFREHKSYLNYRMLDLLKNIIFFMGVKIAKVFDNKKIEINLF